ncbi:MAG: DUF1559 domain-containing protein [Planctomycetaceae bacterium]|jgi:hypothetical protein|nr:DUF1559 domain-containing protein [Planctomycetaceae bacterium]
MSVHRLNLIFKGLTKKQFFLLGVIYLIALLFLGCQNKTENAGEPEGARRVENTGNDAVPAANNQSLTNNWLQIPLPTETELKTLGQEISANQKYLKYLPDNPVSFITVSPDRASKSEYLSQFTDVAGNIIAGFLNMFQMVVPTSEQIPFHKFLRITSCTKPAKLPATRHPQTGAPLYQSLEQVPLTVNILELKEPVDDLTILAAFNQFGVASESLTPTVQGTIKFYDLIPATEQSPILVRVAIVDSQIAVLAAGTLTEISQLFDSQAATGAIPSRILHTNLEETDLALFYSSEGVAAGATVMFDPYSMFFSLFTQNQQITQEQFEKDATEFAKQVKCITLKIDLQAKNAAKLVSIDLSTAASSNVPPIKSALESALINVKTLANFDAEKLNNNAEKQGNETNEIAALNKKRVFFTTKLLDAVKVSESGTLVQASLIKTAELEQPLSEQLSEMFITVRERTWAENNVKTFQGITDGLNRYIESHEKRFPDYAIFDENGTPLLSWRVAILPSLGEEELYKQFHLNEAWDSEHNQTLLDKMPKAFADPNGLTAANKSIFRMIGGTGSFLESHKGGFAMSDVKNPADTIYLIAVTPEQAAEWTKPEFVQYDASAFHSLVHHLFAAFFCSGNAVVLPVDAILATNQLRYWVAGEVSPEIAEMRQRQLEQQMQYQKYLQQAQQAEREHQLQQAPTQFNAVPNAQP